MDFNALPGCWPNLPNYISVFCCIFKRFFIFFVELELLVSEDGVKQAKFCKVLRGNVLKDVAELKERMANIVTTKGYIHKQQIKQFHKK